MWTEITPGKWWPARGGLPKPRRAATGAALLVFPLLLAGAGCAHKELLAPCADYKAAAYTPGAPGAGLVPCDTPQQMHRPPWLTASEAGPASPQEG